MKVSLRPWRKIASRVAQRELVASETPRGSGRVEKKIDWKIGETTKKNLGQARVEGRFDDFHGFWSHFN
jgi:hypothetical protein